MTSRLSTRLNIRRLTRQQEAFAQLVADGTPVTEAVQRVYRDQQHPSAYGRTLKDNPKVRSRIEQLQQQRETIAGLSRDSLTVAALETAEAAREDKSYSASISGLRLVGDLQGLTTSNPVAEATTAFLMFLRGDAPALEGEREADAPAIEAIAKPVADDA